MPNHALRGTVAACGCLIKDTRQFPPAHRIASHRPAPAHELEVRSRDHMSDRSGKWPPTHTSHLALDPDAASPGPLSEPEASNRCSVKPTQCTILWTLLLLIIPARLNCCEAPSVPFAAHRRRGQFGRG